LFADPRAVLGASLLIATFQAAPCRAADPPAHAVLEIAKNSAGEETITHGVLLDGHPGLVVTVAASVEEKATFLVGPHPRTAERQPTPATVALFDPGSRVLFLKLESPLTGVPAVKVATMASTTTAPLNWLPADGPQPAIDAGPLRQLDGRPLALTLRRLHFGSSRENDRPVPGTPVFNEQGDLAALPLSPLPEETGAWLGLPATAIAKLASDFAAVGHAETGLLELGIAIGTTTPRIEFVKPGSRAQKAGLVQGDILLSLGGRPITDVFDVLDANFFLTSREPVTIRLLRGLETMSVTAPPVMPAK
jgi:membrane-associated protease RseP (regulator of RpoE activity)